VYTFEEQATWRLISQFQCCRANWSVTPTRRETPVVSSDNDIPYSRADEPLARVPRVARGIYFCPNFLLFLCPTSFSILWGKCVYIHIPDLILYMNYRCYQITLREKQFYTNRGRCAVLTIFIIRAPAWRWLGEYVTLDKMFCSLILEQEVVAASVTSKLSSLSHFSRKPLLEIRNNYTMHQLYT